ncbi:hypothetical protein PM082_024300 [Marasmius tenuissimus]|nr:hypothetical protein PM082_024300 [Marasmius tenuissimus]
MNNKLGDGSPPTSTAGTGPQCRSCPPGHCGGFYADEDVPERCLICGHTQLQHQISRRTILPPAGGVARMGCISFQARSTTDHCQFCNLQWGAHERLPMYQEEESSGTAASNIDEPA